MPAERIPVKIDKPLYDELREAVAAMNAAGARLSITEMVNEAVSAGVVRLKRTEQYRRAAGLAEGA